MTWLVVPVRPGDDNEELRHAMRSWETHLILPELQIMTVGNHPSWMKPDHHIEGNRFTSVPLAVFDNVLLGAREAVGLDAEQIIYMNDDFFCLDPVGAVLPVKRHVTLAEHIQAAGASSSWWGRSLRLTASWLSEQGYTHPDSYEVHRPLICDPWAMIHALDTWQDEYPLGSTESVPQWRTAYGVINKIEAHPVKDAKLSKNQTGVGTPWVSTSDQSWRVYSRSIKQRFQKPSRWEITQP